MILSKHHPKTDAVAAKLVRPLLIQCAYWNRISRVAKHHFVLEILHLAVNAVSQISYFFNSVCIFPRHGIVRDAGVNWCYIIVLNYVIVSEVKMNKHINGYMVRSRNAGQITVPGICGIRPAGCGVRATNEIERISWGATSL